MDGSSEKDEALKLTDDSALEKPLHRLTKRGLVRAVYLLARTYPNYNYATISGDGELRIVTTDQKNFKVKVTEE